MASTTTRSRRPLDLVIGHILFAPLAGFWTAALVGFAFGRLSPLVGGRWDPQSVTLGGAAFGYYGGNLLFFAPLGMTLSVAVAYACWRRHPWASRMAAALAVTSLITLVNALDWPPGLPRFKPWVPSPVLLLFGLTLSWFTFVLVRTREAWRPPQPVDRPSARRARLLVALAMLSAFAVWHAPLYYRVQSRSGLQALWNQDSAYVCAVRVTSAARTTLGAAAWDRVGVFRLTGSGWRVRQDLMVAEIGADGFNPREFQDLPIWGEHCFIYQGVLHYELERPNRERVAWRWTGHEFAPLTDDESRVIWSAMGREGHIVSLTNSEGWQLTHFPPGHVVRADLRGTPAEIRVRATRPPRLTTAGRASRRSS